MDMSAITIRCHIDETWFSRTRSFQGSSLRRPIGSLDLYDGDFKGYTLPSTSSATRTMTQADQIAHCPDDHQNSCF